MKIFLINNQEECICPCCGSPLKYRDSRKRVHRISIPADLKDIVKREDIPFLAQSAYDDACRPGNPKETSVEGITKLYESLI